MNIVLAVGGLTMAKKCCECGAVLTARERERYGDRCHSDRPDDEPVIDL